MVRLLPGRLAIASLPGGRSGWGTKSVLGAVLFPETVLKQGATTDSSDDSSSRSSVLSVTVSDDELSMVLNESALSFLQAEIATTTKGLGSAMFQPPLKVSQDRLRAIEVEEGEQAILACGYVASLSRVLADASIEVVYVSLFTTDLLLVNENDAERALELLQEREREEQEGATPLDGAAGSTTLDHPVVCTVLTGTYVVAQLKQSVGQLSHSLIGELLALWDPQLIRSFSTSGHCEPSMILPAQSVDKFPLNSLRVNEGRWKVIQAHCSSLQNSVNKLSCALAQASVPIYFLSTFEADFFLIPEDSLDRARAALEALSVEFEDD